jgi:hypothetical protein
MRGGGYLEAEHGLWVGAIQWLLLMSVPVGVVQDVLLVGDTFAPTLHMCDGVPIQHFLQAVVLDMRETVARAVGDLDSILNFSGLRCVV